MKGKDQRPHVGIFGRCNSGKSSLFNRLIGQDIAVVSPVAGTTTDPVKKTTELLHAGPVVFIDTAGIDDEGSVGSLRTARAKHWIAQSDVAILTVMGNSFGAYEKGVASECQRLHIPVVIVHTMSDIEQPNMNFLRAVENELGTKPIVYDNTSVDALEAVKRAVAETLAAAVGKETSLLGAAIGEGDHVVLVTPIDSSAPKGRLILPQVQVLRDILDHHALSTVCQVEELPRMLSLVPAPKLVITDSQAFKQVAAVVPESIMLTSFSVVLAHAKGLFNDYLAGTPCIDRLQNGDKVLILESCTHDVTCEDIGRVKLPKMLSTFTGKNLDCQLVAGLSPLPANIADYAMVIQCGGCVITERQLYSRIEPAVSAGVPVSNYGLALAYMNGIFQRSTQIFRI